MIAACALLAPRFASLANLTSILTQIGTSRWASA
jgi:hypothetical protein